MQNGMGGPEMYEQDYGYDGYEYEEDFESYGRGYHPQDYMMYSPRHQQQMILYH